MLKSQLHRVSPVSLNTLRSLFGSAFLLLFLTQLGKLGEVTRIPVVPLLYLVGSVLIGLVLGDTLFFRSMGLIGVSRAMPIASSYPLLTLALAAIFLGESITWITALGTLLVVAGVYLVATPPAQSAASIVPANKEGVGLALIAAVCWALSTAILKIGITDLDILAAAGVRMWATALVLTSVVSLRQQERVFRPHDQQFWLIVTTASFLGTGGGSLLYVAAVQLAGAARAATLTSTSPLFAAPLSALFLGEKLTIRIIIGMLLTVGGVWLVLPGG